MGGKISLNTSVTWLALNTAGRVSIRPRGRRKVEETHCCISEREGTPDRQRDFAGRETQVC